MQLLSLGVLIIFIFAAFIFVKKYLKAKRTKSFLDNIEKELLEKQKKKEQLDQDNSNQLSEQIVVIQKEIIEKPKFEIINTTTKKDDIQKDEVIPLSNKKEITQEIFHIRKEYPEFDIEVSAEELRMEVEEIEEFINEFIEQLDDRINELYKLYEQEKWEELERLIHLLKGSATNLRISGIADILIEFNTYLRSENIEKEQVKFLIDDLEYYFDKLKMNFY